MKLAKSAAASLLLLPLFLSNGSVSAQLNAYGLPQNYVPCAREGDRCNFQGRAEIVFGRPGAYVVGIHSNSIACSSAVFGDPAPGQPKACFRKVEAQQGPTAAEQQNRANSRAKRFSKFR